MLLIINKNWENNQFKMLANSIMNKIISNPASRHHNNIYYHFTSTEGAIIWSWRTDKHFIFRQRIIYRGFNNIQGVRRGDPGEVSLVLIEGKARRCKLQY